MIKKGVKIGEHQNKCHDDNTIFCSWSYPLKNTSLRNLKNNNTHSQKEN